MKRACLLWLILCLAVPVQGLASLVMPAAHCPMQSGAMAAADTPDDCCSSTDPGARQACQTCHLTGVAQGFSPSFVFLLTAGLPTASSLPSARVDGEPSDVWRPPRI